MLVRPMRTLIAILATLGLLAAASALPAAAATCTAASDAGAAEAGLSHDASFHCTEAELTGTWTITVEVVNDTDADVTISAVEVTGVTPATAADAAAAAELTSDTLPVTIAAGTTGSFDVTGSHTLAQLGAAALLDVHLKATGTSADSPVTLAINVHLFGAGTTPAEAGAQAQGSAVAEIASQGGEDGKPDWLPGPPPWVVALILQLHPDGLQAAAFTDAAVEASQATVAGSEVAAEAGADAAAGASTRVPSQVTLPAQAGAGAGAAAGGGAEVEDAGVTIEVEAGASGQVIVAPIGGRP